MWNEFNCAVAWIFFGLALLGDWNENWLFQIFGLSWVFQICWHIECTTFTASFFRIWNNSTGIPSSPLASLIVLPKAHLTSHSRMSGSRWVITTKWLSGSLRYFFYSFSVYSCHLFWISSASVRSIPFLNVPLVSLIFLKRSLVFPIVLFSSVSLHWSLRKAFLSFLAILWILHSDGCIFPFFLCLLLLFFSHLFVRPPQITILPCLHFFFLGMVLITASCTMSQIFVHRQALCLSDLIPWIYFSLPLYNHKVFDLGHIWIA